MATKYLLLLFIAIYYVNDVKACSCISTHPQVLFCDADFVMQVRLRGKPEDIYRKEEVMAFDEDTNSREPVIQRTKLAVKYNVKIRKIFKVNDNNFGLNFTSTVTQLYSPPHDGLCGIYLDQRTNYLISGKYSNEDLHIELCNSLHTPWDWVSKIQKKALRFTYRKNCDCKVRNTHFTTEVDSINTCKWDEFSRTGDCYKRHTACIHDKNSSTGGCKWQRNNQLRKCRSDKKSRRQEP